MLNKQRIFDECLEKNVGVRSGVATVTMLKAAFVCMRARFEESNASDEDRRAFVEAIAQAIQHDPGLASKDYEHDKVELQKVLRSAFAGIPYEPTEPPLLAPKVSFLSRVRP